MIWSACSWISAACAFTSAFIVKYNAVSWRKRRSSEIVIMNRLYKMRRLRITPIIQMLCICEDIFSTKPILNCVHTQYHHILVLYLESIGDLT